MAERNSVAKVTYPDNTTSVLQWEFKDAEPPVAFDVSALPQEMIIKLARHGLKQKGSDGYAGVKGNIAEARKILSETLKNIRENVWTVRIAGEGGARVTQLAEALSRVTGKPIDDCVAAVQKLAEQDEADEGSRIAALRKHAQIAVVLATIKVERATAAAAAAQAKAAGATEATQDVTALLG